MNKSFKVYLSGRVTGRNKVAVKKERSLAKKLLNYIGLRVFDPIAHEYKLDKKPIFKVDKLSLMKGFIKREKRALKTCDAILVLTGDHLSDGTLLELGYALYRLSLPAVFISKKRFKKQIISWANLETIVVPDLIQAVKVLKELEGK